MKALLALNSLSGDEKALLKSKQIEAERTPDEWLALLKKFGNFDKQADGARYFTGGIGCLGSLLAVGALILTAVIGIFGLLLLLLSLAFAVAGVSAYFYLKRFDVPGDVLINKVIPILLVLREEMASADKLKMRLDLRGFALAEKLRNQSQPYKSGAYHKVVDSFYQDQWFDGDATLADGTRLIWSLTDLARRQNKTKRTARGKTKYKTKDKHRTFVSMQIGLNKRVYEFPEKIKIKAKRKRIVTKSVEGYDWMNVRRTIKHSTGATFQPTDFVNAVATAYKRAVPQKR